MPAPQCSPQQCVRQMRLLSTAPHRNPRNDAGRLSQVARRCGNRVGRTALAGLGDRIVRKAVCPVLSRLFRPHHRMISSNRMFAGVSVGRTVAAAGFATGHAEAEVYPCAANGQALDATALGHGIKRDVLQMFTRRASHQPSFLGRRLRQALPRTQINLPREIRIWASHTSVGMRPSTCETAGTPCEAHELDAAPRVPA